VAALVGGAGATGGAGRRLTVSRAADIIVAAGLMAPEATGGTLLVGWEVFVGS
jgi:hypothetical protein